MLDFNQHIVGRNCLLLGIVNKINFKIKTNLPKQFFYNKNKVVDFSLLQNVPILNLDVGNTNRQQSDF